MRTTIIEIINELNQSPRTAGELVERLGHEWNTIRKTLATLEKAGWVKPNGFKKRFDGGGLSAVLWESQVKIG
jgi:DNA-binding IclR family transcriptional regulator